MPANSLTAPPFSPPETEDVDVFVVGGGPVGTALALDLAWRGVKVLLAERESIVHDEVRARGLNARTMEHFRRLGVADAIRQRDRLPHALYDASVVTTAVSAPPISVIPRPQGAVSVPGTDRRAPGHVAELPHILPQPQIVQVLRDRVLELGGQLALGWEVVRIRQTRDQVIADLRETATGRPRRVAALYAVGADGARSLVRDVAGIRVDTTPPLGKRLSVTFHAPGLAERADVPPYARFLLPRGDGFDLLTTHAPDKWGFGLGPFPLEADLSTIDLVAEARRLVGADIELEIESARPWPVQRAVAERYRAGRLFIAGDAAHTCPPTGGQNMNTGIGDAMNLSWKLAAVIDGWAGVDLLDTYETERRPVGIRNTTWSLDNTSLVPAGAALDGTEAQARSKNLERQGFGNLSGIILDLRYNSPIVVGDGTDEAAWHPNEFAGGGIPGHRAPHVWLSGDVSLYDRLGPGYTLLDLTGAADVRPLLDAAAARGVPLDVLALDDAGARAAYGAALALVRPDQQVAWRGDALPADAAGLVDTIRGEAAAHILKAAS